MNRNVSKFGKLVKSGFLIIVSARLQRQLLIRGFYLNFLWINSNYI